MSLSEAAVGWISHLTLKILDTGGKLQYYSESQKHTQLSWNFQFIQEIVTIFVLLLLLLLLFNEIPQMQRTNAWALSRDTRGVKIGIGIFTLPILCIK